MSDKLKIVVLDDSELVLGMTVQAFRDAGFDVFPANSLVEFETILATHAPHIVLTDINMPEIRGDNICRVLKQKLETESIPIVLFSTLEEQELAILADKAGADGYVSKSAGIEEIVRKIESLTDEILF